MASGKRSAGSNAARVFTDFSCSRPIVGKVLWRTSQFTRLPDHRPYGFLAGGYKASPASNTRSRRRHNRYVRVNAPVYE